MKEDLENILWDYADGLLNSHDKIEIEKRISADKFLQKRLKEIRLNKSEMKFISMPEPEADFTLRVLSAWQKESGIPMLEPVKNINWIIWLIVGVFISLLVSGICIVLFIGSHNSGLMKPNAFVSIDFSHVISPKLLAKIQVILGSVMVLGIADFVIRKVNFNQVHITK